MLVVFDILSVPTDALRISECFSILESDQSYLLEKLRITAFGARTVRSRTVENGRKSVFRTQTFLRCPAKSAKEVGNQPPINLRKYAHCASSAYGDPAMCAQFVCDVLCEIYLIATSFLPCLVQHYSYASMLLNTTALISHALLGAPKET